MISLKKAIETNNLKKFVDEHKQDDDGDQEAIERTIKRMVDGKSSADRKASDQDNRDD